MLRILALLCLTVLVLLPSCQTEGSDKAQYTIRGLSIDNIDYAYNWVPCCDFEADKLKDFGSSKTNFVVPVTTAGSAFGFFEGLSGLNDLASKSNVFRYVEPFAIVNPGNDALVPLRRLVKMNGLATFDKYLSLFDWGNILGLKNFTSVEMEKSLHSRVVHLEFEQVKTERELSCDSVYASRICLRMIRRGSGASILQLQYHQYQVATFRPALIQSLFVYIISSRWAKETGFNSEEPISFGLLGKWPRHAVDIGLLPSPNNIDAKSITLLDRATPVFLLSDYLIWNAEVVLKQLYNPTVMVTWSVLQRNSSALLLPKDELGFSIGCEMDALYMALPSAASGQATILSFDLFHSKVKAEQDWMTIYTKRDIVRSIRAKFMKPMVIPNLLEKNKITQLDPYKLFAGSMETFSYWLDIAIGTQVSTLVTDQGDMGNTIRLVRGAGRPAAIVAQSSNCARLKPRVREKGDVGQVIDEDDDQVKMLVHDDIALEKMLAGEN